jgi:RNA polymerase sigma-70 factor (sigma-E family)
MAKGVHCQQGNVGVRKVPIPALDRQPFPRAARLGRTAHVDRGTTVRDTPGEADFSAYVLARQRGLVRFAYLLTGDPHQAEDIVQAALLKVYRHWGSISGSADAYVRTALVNEFRSWWRRPGRRREVTNSDLVIYRDPAQADVHPDHDLRAQIAALPRQQRAAIVLRYYEDLTEAQTAEILGCTIGTVKSHTSRALSNLRVSMKEALS